jgi:DNA invertase Pin-like site-specific DNA recombinase
MRAALYARFSTDKQRRESLDDQFRACERVAVSCGLTTVARFSDAGISGGTSERPGYQAMLAAVRGGGIDIIVTEDLSRLWRNRATYGRDSAELEDAGVHLVTGTGDDTRRDGWGLMLSIKSAIAEHARKEISYRTRRGMEGLALAGKSTGGRCYGYQSAGEASVVVEIYRAFVAGRRPSEIARELNARNVPGPRGPRWSLNAVKRVLGNGRYAGRLAWGKTETKGGARDSRLKRAVVRPGGPLVIRTVPALVDPLEWQACNPGVAVA